MPGKPEPEWVDMSAMEAELFPQKGKRNPLVLVGAFATAGVLMAGLVSFHKGNQALSQSMMRARVVAQGATVALMVGTSGYLSNNLLIGGSSKTEESV
mmetsp:Transcript_26996/g.48084  ORF Transcript_26996/g.48084 Transcript_26996/m.48084 type:complete len:98 (-) Transcript_26996:258-551(-)